MCPHSTASSLPKHLLTSVQGSAIIAYFLSLPSSPYRIRALTRDPNSPAAQQLTASGVEVIRADLDEPASLVAALKDVHAVFLVTDFFSCPDAGAIRETAQAKRVLDILSTSPTFQQLIYSSLPSIRSASAGKYQAVVHFDGKADVVQWLKTTHGQVWEKMTVLWVGTYMQLWKQFKDVFAPKKRVTDAGKEVWELRSVFWGETKLPLVDVRDVGRAVGAILGDFEGLAGGRTVSLVSQDQISMTEQLSIWGDCVGKEVVFRNLSEEESWRSIGGLGFEDFLAKAVWEVGLAYRDFEGRLLHGEGVLQISEVRCDVCGWDYMETVLIIVDFTGG